MPVIKSAKKKLRQDRKREFQNEGVRNILRTLIKKARLEKTEKTIIEAVKMADKAAKKHIIHKNKAARIKSSLAKLAAQKVEVKQKKTAKSNNAAKNAVSA